MSFAYTKGRKLIVDLELLSLISLSLNLYLSSALANMEAIFALHLPKLPFLLFPSIKNLIAGYASSFIKVKSKLSSLSFKLETDEENFRENRLPDAVKARFKNLFVTDLSESELESALILVSKIELGPLRARISTLKADLVNLQANFLAKLSGFLAVCDFSPKPGEDGWEEFFELSFSPLFKLLCTHFSVEFFATQQKHLEIKNKKEEKKKILLESKSAPLILTEDVLVSKLKELKVSFVSEKTKKTQKNQKIQKNHKNTNSSHHRKQVSSKPQWVKRQQGNGLLLRKSQGGVSVSKKRGAQANNGENASRRRQN